MLREHNSGKKKKKAKINFSLEKCNLISKMAKMKLVFFFFFNFSSSVSVSFISSVWMLTGNVLLIVNLFPHIVMQIERQIGSCIHLKLAEALVHGMAYSDWPKLSWREGHRSNSRPSYKSIENFLGGSGCYRLQFLLVFQEAILCCI